MFGMFSNNCRVALLSGLKSHFAVLPSSVRKGSDSRWLSNNKQCLKSEKHVWANSPFDIDLQFMKFWKFSDWFNSWWYWIWRQWWLLIWSFEVHRYIWSLWEPFLQFYRWKVLTAPVEETSQKTSNPFIFSLEFMIPYFLFDKLPNQLWNFVIRVFRSWNWRFLDWKFGACTLSCSWTILKCWTLNGPRSHEMWTGIC